MKTEKKTQLPFFDIEKFCVCHFEGSPAPFYTVHARLMYTSNAITSKEFSLQDIMNQFT